MRPLVYFVALVATASAADVRFEPGRPAVAFAAEEVERALAERGENARIWIGRHAWLPDGVAKKPPPVPEAFTITRSDDGSIAIAGHDAVGAMYGGLEVAEQIALGGVAAVRSTAGEPFLKLRQYKYNVPSVRGQEWFHDPAYWRSLFGLLARARINSISFWHRHPFPDMIRLRDAFPEAARLSPEQIERNIKTWRMILRLAAERGLSAYLVNWNIHLPRGFAEAHGLEADGEDAPIVRKYMRFCVAETLRTYPRLTGIGLCAGERMPSDDYHWRERWIKDTFLAGIRDSGRRDVPLLHRYWWASPDSIRRIICPDSPAPVYVSVKFNGEHMYTDTRPHFLDPDWIDFPDHHHHLRRETEGEVHGVVSHLEWIPREPYPYKIVWHLRNDTIHTYRWGAPAFVRETVRNCKQPWSVGFLMGEERTQRGVDTELATPAREHQTWRYHHERHWFRFLLWGRLGYDPTIPDGRWIALFEQRYGKGIGEDLFVALRAASRIIPLVSRFHFNYMNGDWAPEWCAGSWNTGFGRGRNYRDGRDDFHDVVEFIFNHTIGDRYLDIPEWIGLKLRGEDAPEGTVSPADVAERLSKAARDAQMAVERVRSTGELAGDAALLCQELAAQAELGQYYAEKIVAATALMRFFVTGDAEDRRQAAGRLEDALDTWQRLSDKAGTVYRKAASGSRSYPRNLPRVRRDILLAQTAGSAPDELRKLGVLQRAKERPHYDFNSPDLRELIETKLAPAVVPIFAFNQVDLSPETCDVIVLGREAWAFDDLPDGKKRLVLDAVEQGAGLVIFFQNFPRFDASWLPGGIGGRDRDSDSFAWTDREHPIAHGVDPDDLAGNAILNDALIGYDESWTCLTDPPGGLCIRQHGKGRIVFCQLDVPHRYRIRAARRLVRSMVRFASGGKKEPQAVVLDTSSNSTARILRKAGIRFRWVDELPLKER
jgi:hypothetical protein